MVQYIIKSKSFEDGWLAFSNCEYNRLLTKYCVTNTTYEAYIPTVEEILYSYYLKRGKGVTCNNEGVTIVTSLGDTVGLRILEDGSYVLHATHIYASKEPIRFSDPLPKGCERLSYLPRIHKIVDYPDIIGYMEYKVENYVPKLKWLRKETKHTITYWCPQYSHFGVYYLYNKSMYDDDLGGLCEKWIIYSLEKIMLKEARKVLYKRKSLFKLDNDVAFYFKGGIPNTGNYKWLRPIVNSGCNHYSHVMRVPLEMDGNKVKWQALKVSIRHAKRLIRLLI